jgi:hypothetical protein
MLIGMSSSVDSSSSSSATFVVDLLSPSTIRDERELRVAPSHTVTNHLSLPAGEAAVAAALGVVGALLLLAGVVGGVCWWRRVRRATVAFTTLHDETWRRWRQKWTQCSWRKKESQTPQFDWPKKKIARPLASQQKLWKTKKIE